MTHDAGICSNAYFPTLPVLSRSVLILTVFSEELYLSEEQAAQFAVTYREFMAERAKLNEQFKAKFAKNLNERQVARVLHFRGHRKGDFRKGDFRKGEFKKGDFKKRGFDAKRRDLVRK